MFYKESRNILILGDHILLTLSTKITMELAMATANINMENLQPIAACKALLQSTSLNCDCETH